MSAFDLTVFTICVVSLAFLAGALGASTGRPIRQKLMFWGGYLVLAAGPAYGFIHLWPVEGSEITVFSSTNKDNSLVGPTGAIAFVASVFGASWAGKRLANILLNHIFGDPKS